MPPRLSSGLGRQYAVNMQNPFFPDFDKKFQERKSSNKLPGLFSIETSWIVVA